MKARKIIIISAIIFYLLLTIVKFFTVAMITTPGALDAEIYFKIHPTTTNWIVAGEAHETFFANYYTWRYSWYNSGQFWQITNTHRYSFLVHEIYTALIYLWWILSAGLIVFALFKVYLLGKH